MGDTLQKTNSIYTTGQVSHLYLLWFAPILIDPEPAFSIGNWTSPTPHSGSCHTLESVQIRAREPILAPWRLRPAGLLKPVMPRGQYSGRLSPASKCFLPEVVFFLPLFQNSWCTSVLFMVGITSFGPWLCLSDVLKQRQTVPFPPGSSRSSPCSHSLTAVIFSKWARDVAVLWWNPSVAFCFLQDWAQTP